MDDTARMAKARTVRFAVFVDEQHVPIEEEADVADRSDPAAVHVLVCSAADTPIATGRFFEREDGAVQIGRMAVMRPDRGRGVGMLMLNALMDEARNRGYVAAVLFAQVHAQQFYERAGFAAYGEPFTDAGILHIAMRRTL
ncbi:MAG: GNAT family N-acetyltransferase [Vulcanimicrobiaceae bacterium]